MILLLEFEETKSKTFVSKYAIGPICYFSFLSQLSGT